MATSPDDPDPAPDRAEILRALNLLSRGDHYALHEIRILNRDKSGTISGYYTDPTRIVDASAENAHRYRLPVFGHNGQESAEKARSSSWNRHQNRPNFCQHHTC